MPTSHQYHHPSDHEFYSCRSDPCNNVTIYKPHFHSQFPHSSSTPFQHLKTNNQNKEKRGPVHKVARHLSNAEPLTANLVHGHKPCTSIKKQFCAELWKRRGGWKNVLDTHHPSGLGGRQAIDPHPWLRVRSRPSTITQDYGVRTPTRVALVSE
jgi:hypothetical protein